MNTTLLSHSSSTPRRHAQHWLRELQFAVGVMVALGGAGVIVARFVQYFA